MDTEDAEWVPAGEDSHDDDWFRRLWCPGKRVFHQALGLGVVQSHRSHLSLGDSSVSVLWWNDVLSESDASELMPFFSHGEPVRRLLTNNLDDLCFFEGCPRWSAGDTRRGLHEPFSITNSPLALVRKASDQKYVSFGQIKSSLKSNCSQVYVPLLLLERRDQAHGSLPMDYLNGVHPTPPAPILFLPDWFDKEVVVIRDAHDHKGMYGRIIDVNNSTILVNLEASGDRCFPWSDVVLL
jgi:hypothetical protein